MLSDAQCRTAKPKLKKYKIGDSEGLYLEVMPNGSKYWRLKYRYMGKEKRVALGVYPSISLQKAREEKKQIKEYLQNGNDPVLTRFELKQTAIFRQAITFSQVANEWHEKHKASWNKKYAKTLLHRLEKYVFPYIGNFPIDQVSPVLMLACLQKIELTAPEMARRVKQICSLIFKYGIATNRLQNDVTYGLKEALSKYKKGHFAALSVDELPQFIYDLHDNKERFSKQTFLAIKLMMLTFVRTKELIEAKWIEVNFEKAMWVIPAERMKMKSPHMVPLSKQAISLFKELKNMNGKSEYIFPSLPRPKKSMSNNTILFALGRMGYKHRMTGHGFRSLALGVLKEKLGYSHEIADRQLAHVPKNSTDRAYDRAQFLPQRTSMMQDYANYLDNVYLGVFIKKLKD